MRYRFPGHFCAGADLSAIYAVAAGLELAIYCDLRVADPILALSLACVQTGAAASPVGQADIEGPTPTYPDLGVCQ